MKRALAFLTPFGVASTPNETTLAWFPLVGALVGFGVGGLWWLAAKAWAPLLAAAIAVVGDLVFTGLLHFDGLADAGDGLLAPMSRERRLEVMSDPVIGAFGAVTIAVVLILRWGSFASLRPEPFVIAGLWCGSRTAMIIITESLSYARPSGLVQRFLTTDGSPGLRVVRRLAVVVGVAASVVLVTIEGGFHGAIALGAELLAIALVALFSRHRLGGYTGDVLGAAAVVGETIGLLILAIR
jgi:adenosylcobinamide-GDP ribazoletransferase